MTTDGPNKDSRDSRAIQRMRAALESEVDDPWAMAEEENQGSVARTVRDYVEQKPPHHGD